MIMKHIRIRRIYLALKKYNGFRVLVDRLSKELKQNVEPVSQLIEKPKKSDINLLYGVKEVQ